MGRDSVETALTRAFRIAIQRDFCGGRDEDPPRGWHRKAAAKVGLSQPMVTQLWNGTKTKVDWDSLRTLAQYTGVSADELLGLPVRESLQLQRQVAALTQQVAALSEVVQGMSIPPTTITRAKTRGGA